MSPGNSQVKEIVIIGAGWSGLSAACYLVSNNQKVSIYESSKQIGGRARSIRLENISQTNVDNGQHILIGAYHETLALLQLISANTQSSLKRQKLSLNMFNKNDKLLLGTSNLPSPFHLLFGLVFCGDLSFSQKLRVIHFNFKLSSKSILKNGDMSVADLLLKFKQPDKLIKALWEPLCLATLNTPIKYASAKLYITVLQKSLLGKKNDSDFLFTTKDLNLVLPEPASNYLQKHNTKIELSSRASKIIINNNAVEGVIINDKMITTKNIILALPPYACAKLLSGHNELSDITNQLTQFEYQPICTVYLQYPDTITMNKIMIGAWGTTIQWLFDRKIVNQNGLIAAIISANGPHMKYGNEELIQIVETEIHQIFPAWPAPLYSKVVREKRATFSSNVNISKTRPYNKTPVKGLWLCGDYTNTDLPATLEGAVISGKSAATEITSLKEN